MTKILILIIKTYKYLISPLIGNRCRFLPTCSEYFIEALKTQGLVRGLKLGSKRILKCHPIKSLGGAEGLDLVPSKNKRERKNG
jgi:putative membrane protein insertion efficiency factor